MNKRTESVVCISDFSYAYPGGEKYVLKNVNQKIARGECFCLTGSTGSGKTTLAHAINGMLPPGRREGEITISDSGALNGICVGTVFQNPETQLLCETVEEEIASGLENIGENPDIISEKIDSALQHVNLEANRRSPVTSLSMGQKYRLIIASFLAMNPALLVLDEPGGQLDDRGIADLTETIRTLKRQGYSFLICEHHPALFHAVVDRYGHLEADGIVAEPSSIATQHNGMFDGIHGEVNRAEHPELVRIEGLSFAYPGSGSVLRDLSFTLSRGQRVVISGENGSGKSTLLRIIAGFQKPDSGVVLVKERIPEPKKMRGIIGYLVQNPQRQLFEHTVFKEVAFTLARIRPGQYDVRGTVMEVLRTFGISSLSDCSPFTLSYGQQHLVTLASVLAPEPEILVLDDPFAGLDHKRRECILDILYAASIDKGMAIILTSHHASDYRDWSTMTLKLEDGRLDPYHN